MAITRIGNPAIADQRGVNFRNIIINGDMSVSQRGTSTASITASGYHSIDRFQTSASSIGTWTQSQSTDVPTGQGFAKSLKMDCTTADASPAASDNLIIIQKFEGQNLQYLLKGTSSAKQLTLSFWVKSNKTGTYIAGLHDRDNSRIVSKSYTISSANTWEKKTITFPADTTGAFDNDNAGSLDIQMWLAAGSDFSGGTLATTWQSQTNANRAVGQVNLADSTSNEWYITGVQLEAGQVASDFEFLPFDVNTQRCLRYYQKSYAYETALGAATDAGTYLSAFTVNASNQNFHTVNLQSIMRTSPTAVFYSSSTGATGKYRSASDAADYDATVSSVTDKMLRFRPSSNTGVNDGDRFNFHFTVDAEL
jgi:hypothetical protein